MPAWHLSRIGRPTISALAFFPRFAAGKSRFDLKGERARIRAILPPGTWITHKALLLVSIDRENNFAFPVDRGHDYFNHNYAFKARSRVNLSPRREHSSVRPYVNAALRFRSSLAVKLCRKRSLLCAVLSIAVLATTCTCRDEFAIRGLSTACRQIIGTFPCNPRDLLTRAKSRVYASGIHQVVYPTSPSPVFPRFLIVLPLKRFQ